MTIPQTLKESRETETLVSPLQLSVAEVGLGGASVSNILSSIYVITHSSYGVLLPN